MPAQPGGNSPRSLPDRDHTKDYIEDEGPVMGFFEHLEDLRRHLIRAGLALAVTTLLSMFFTGPILEYLLRAAPEGADGMRQKLQILGPTESVVVYFRVALMAGAVFAMPIIIWQLLGFVMPGLTARERRWVWLAVPGAMFLFLLGIAFAWFIMAPAALGFLRDFQQDVFEVEWTADAYIAFLTTLLFWIGISFEMPLIFFVLGRLGLIGPGVLARNWRLAVVGVSIAAALITPTIDPFNMGLVMLPLLGLYVLSICLTAIAYRQSGIGKAEREKRS